MASQKLVQSNRVNALKSTGPRSETGKAAVALNALKSGIYAKAEIIPGEDLDELEKLTAEYGDHYVPADPQERYHLDIMIRADWQSRRLARVESQLYIYRSYSLSRIPADAPLGFIYWGTDKVFARLQRQINAAHRTYTEASRELASLQSARLAAGDAAVDGDPSAEAAPASAPGASLQPIDAETTSPQIGFVSSTPSGGAGVTSDPPATTISEPSLGLPATPGPTLTIEPASPEIGFVSSNTDCQLATDLPEPGPGNPEMQTQTDPLSRAEQD